MAALTIVVGNKRYSSWSLRGWLAVRLSGGTFDEVVINMKKPDTTARMLSYGPTGKVPVLKHGDITVWESLAIIEYIAETFPAAMLWPTDRAARAHCRASSTEMHSGFQSLRQQMSMDVVRPQIDRTPNEGTATDIARITTLWREARQKYGANGPFLYGAPSVADCMYAPVAAGRFHTFKVKLDPVSAAYVDTILNWAPMQEWTAAARAETDVIAEYD